MKKYLKTDEWNIIEDQFHPDYLRMSESIFSLGNGRFGQRGYFEESYSSDSYRGSFVGGITFLDKTRVGWWKNGFPQYYTRIPKAADWSRINLRLIDEELDLARWDVDSFYRRLDLKEGISYRDMEVTSPRGNQLRIHVEHITDMARPNLCLIKYSVASINYTGKVSLVPLLDGNIENEAAHPNEKIWNILRSGATNDCAYLWTQTRREDAQVCYAMTCQFFKNRKEIAANHIRIEKEKQTGFSVGTDVKPGDCVTLIKYTAINSSLYHERSELVEHSVTEARQAQSAGWDKLVEEHRKAWQEIWDDTDVVIEGDPEAQQGIRYNIFQLYQTYRGDDPRLNIGPKGFTGEKYGGNTYWNTELCCVPFFLLSTPKEVAKNLLAYRYNQLPKAIENARKLGFKEGAALFPQVTNNGEECHNEWEITFEEIHRNNIIVYAIAQHALLTGNMEYIANYGLEVMIAVCRFWSQRVSFSQPKQKYVILGVTGPNEYENNVDNNWYTNYSCIQCLNMTLCFLEIVAQRYPEEYARIRRVTNFDPTEESSRWKDIIERMYLPEDPERGIFIQNDGYMDKVLESTDHIPDEERPINQHWSWDRILRSCYIKQSDVLLGIHLYYFHFDTETVRRNFEFYEPMTVHESSLSPHIHSILAARIGKVEKAYQLFLRATRIDLDDYNNETDQGLHITSMPGSWLAIVRGFAGLQILKNALCFSPVIPQKWSSYSFNVNYLGNTLHIRVGKEIEISLTAGDSLDIQVYENKYTLKRGSIQRIPLEGEEEN
ncbi:MAG: family 65 glycosyl hydrolase [Bacteroides sp.]|nr:family 65 glycosyl hydrolase [Bacteroides sp.]